MTIAPLGAEFHLKFNYGHAEFEGRLASREAAWQQAQEIMSAMQAGDTLTLTFEGNQNEPSSKTRNSK